jgi:tRNA modification GTPase
VAADDGGEQAEVIDTIAAVSSGRPPAAIAVLRVSGPKAEEVARTLAGELPEPRRASMRTLRDAAGAALDQALVLWFSGPRTATGENLLELHLHGGRAVIAAVERAVLAVAGVRVAEAGEFTRRALLNGRIDLAQAEGLADLLAAETEAQRRAALAVAEGGLSRAVAGWLDRLVGIRALVEAMIDHDDEDDVGDHHAAVQATLSALSAELAEALARPTVERASQGIRVVLAGPPNAGKSSLFNALLGRDAAIVTPIAGTTRDRIEAVVHRNGTTFTLVDTAGLNDTTEDVVELMGIVRSRSAMASADLLLWLGESDLPDGAIAIHSRSDLPDRAEVPAGALAVSIYDPASVERIWADIAHRTAGLIPATESYLLHEAQRGLIAEAADDLADCSSDLLVRAESLRRASRALARIVGVDETEAVLDRLFARFCIGK